MSEAILPPRRDHQICALIGTGHFRSHFCMLCLPPIFLVWRAEFDVSFAMPSASLALMSGTTALLLAPVALVAGLCLGSSRTPRDAMLKQACPPGEIGKVSGFVSAGLPPGSALMPVLASLLALSLPCAGIAPAE